MPNVLSKSPSQELAIIRGVEFGMRDGHGEPMLCFTADGFPCSSLQCFVGEDIKKFLTKDWVGESIWVYDIRDLEGAAILMENHGGYSTVKGLYDYNRWRKGKK